MVIFGKKRNFAMTVQAWADLTEILPEHNLDNLGIYLRGSNMGEALEHSAHVAAILNNGGEMARKYAGQEYNEPLPARAFMALGIDEFAQLQEVIRATLAGDEKGTIELVAKKNEVEDGRQ